MSGGTIFGLQPFTPKRILILPCEGSEIMLFVLDGKAYPTSLKRNEWDSRREIHGIHFGGWNPSFRSSTLSIPMAHLHGSGDTAHFELEVVFRLVPSRSHFGQTAEIVAVSYDDGETFYENEMCSLPMEYADAQADRVH